MYKVYFSRKIKLKFTNIRKIFLIFMLLVITTIFSCCSSYEKYYNYFPNKSHEIFYSKEMNIEYIRKFSSFIGKEVSLLYGYFLPEIKINTLQTVVIIDNNFYKVNSTLLKSIDKKVPIVNFDQLLLGEFEYPHSEDEDIAGLNLEGTNLIFIKRNKYDSVENLTKTYLSELSHILLYRNTVRNGIRFDNKYDYLSEFFADIIGLMYLPNGKVYSFSKLRFKLDDVLVRVFKDGYPNTLKDPNNFRVEELYDYLDDFLCLFHLLIEDEYSYEKFKKTMVELFTKQYYTVDKNTIDRPFIDNYGKTLDQLIVEWRPQRM